jgi:uncharacterized protein (TIGR03905 family)
MQRIHESGARAQQKERKKMEYTYKPSGVCTQKIDFDINGNVITNIRFLGGCNGNLKAISKLLEGATVEEIESKLRGNTCGPRPTSCADQLARAVREAYDKQK